MKVKVQIVTIFKDILKASLAWTVCVIYDEQLEMKSDNLINRANDFANTLASKCPSLSSSQRVISFPENIYHIRSKSIVKSN